MPVACFGTPFTHFGMIAVPFGTTVTYFGLLSILFGQVAIYFGKQKHNDTIKNYYYLGVKSDLFGFKNLILPLFNT
ncbi:MAG TPA: hypothetical protein VFS71_07195 [Flavobacterium sp.]|uniref:hypothetical protein n=1 Tax=Flavobacterium sp. TaxID=239 RepID=UPI002DBB9056|nr:hypothetical protein [Flavobacterium sp.]HEU4789453.1 hypothetical protein [Flavobacterium sp.]